MWCAVTSGKATDRAKCSKAQHRSDGAPRRGRHHHRSESGSGKSTFLRLINHLEKLDWGEILVEGQHVGYEKHGKQLRPSRNLAKARARARIGMVFQHFNLFDHLTALENVCEAPIRVYGEEPGGARANAMSLLASVGLRLACQPPPAPPLRRTAAAGRNRACPRDLAPAHVVR